MNIRPRIYRGLLSNSVSIEAGYNEGFVAAIKAVIPKHSRSYGDHIWKVDVRYYSALVALCNHFFGSRWIDNIHGVPEPQTTAWKEVWEAHKNTDASRSRFEQKTILPTLDSYSTLYVTPNAPKEVITAAYRVLAKIHHPDAGGTNEMMTRINAAYTDLQRRGAT